MTMRTEVHVLIVDDEPLARKTLRDHLGSIEWIGRVDEAGDGLTAIRMIDELRPELVFLDIRTPGASGIAVAEQIVHRPYIIFTTAFDRYAVTAFEIGALDYLLKPFGRERVQAALERAREAFDRDLPPVVARAREVLSPSRPLKHLFVKERGRMMAVPLETVERIEACDDYVAVHTGSRHHLVHARLHDLAARLDGASFLRVHRSHVVNLRFVAALEPREGSRLTVVMASGARVPVSRAGTAALKAVSQILRPKA